MEETKTIEEAGAPGETGAPGGDGYAGAPGGDGSGAPGGDGSEVERLSADLAEKAALVEQYFERLARLQADFENFRRRARSEKEELMAFATKGLISKLLPAIDNLERAIRSEAGADPQAWRQGVEMTLKQFQDLLVREGVESIPALGLPFDPSVHEAVMQADSDEHDENTVLEEFQKGYRLAGRVIRPAMVKVSRRP